MTKFTITDKWNLKLVVFFFTSHNQIKKKKKRRKSLAVILQNRYLIISKHLYHLQLQFPKVRGKIFQGH